jgi:hypothetical protein
MVTARRAAASQDFLGRFKKDDAVATNESASIQPPVNPWGRGRSCTKGTMFWTVNWREATQKGANKVWRVLHGPDARAMWPGRPAHVSSSVLSAMASATAEALAKEETPGEGWVPPMSSGRRALRTGFVSRESQIAISPAGRIL